MFKKLYEMNMNMKPISQISQVAFFILYYCTGLNTSCIFFKISKHFESLQKNCVLWKFLTMLVFNDDSFNSTKTSAIKNLLISKLRVPVKREEFSHSYQEYIYWTTLFFTKNNSIAHCYLIYDSNFWGKALLETFY